MRHRRVAHLQPIRLANIDGVRLATMIDTCGNTRSMTGRRLSDPPAQAMLKPDGVDDLALAVLTLTRELWVVADRQAVTEKLLERHGISAAEIDAFQPDVDFAAVLDRRRGALVEAIIGAMRGEKPSA